MKRLCEVSLGPSGKQPHTSVIRASPSYPTPPPETPPAGSADGAGVDCQHWVLNGDIEGLIQETARTGSKVRKTKGLSLNITKHNLVCGTFYSIS